MEFIIVTGLSGAGKSQVIREIEDMGYFCIDNMPPQFIQKFGEICKHTDGSVNKVAIVIDIRGQQFFNFIDDMIEWFETSLIDYKILFLDCSDEVLVRRFKETRRLHPLSYDGKILNGISKERKKLEFLKNKANLIIDTSNLKVVELKQKVRKFLLNYYEDNDFIVQIISFGYKYGIPIECDLTFDVRFIENPFYIESLKNFTGLDKGVKDFVLEKEEAKIFLNKINDLIVFLLPNYIKEGKKQLIIGVGCTGGQHRSVVVSEELYSMLSKFENYKVIIEHRDLK